MGAWLHPYEMVGSLVPFRFSWRTVSLSRTLKLSAGRALRPFCWQNNFSEKQRPKMQTASVPWSFVISKCLLCVGRPLQYRGIPWSRLSEGIDTFISICGFFFINMWSVCWFFIFHSISGRRYPANIWWLKMLKQSSYTSTSPEIGQIVCLYHPLFVVWTVWLLDRA